MNQGIYPIGGNERKMPVYLVGIGLNDWQYHVIRDEGYYFPQIICTIRGKGCLRFDGNEYILTENSCFFLPAKYPHEYFTVGDLWETHWVTFDGYAVSQILNSLGFSTAMVKTLGDLSKLNRIFEKMIVALKSDRLFGEFTCSHLIYQYIIEFYREFFGILSYDSGDKSSVLMPILNYIDENLSENITLDDLCDIARITPQHLCRIFKKAFNLRPIEYISKKRVQKAKELLITTNRSIADISEQVGYHDSCYFGVVFKKYESVTPGQYRSANK